MWNDGCHGVPDSSFIIQNSSFELRRKKWECGMMGATGFQIRHSLFKIRHLNCEGRSGNVE
jgi:hypothetical protein